MPVTVTQTVCTCVNCFKTLDIMSEICVMLGKMQFAVFPASHIFQTRFQDAFRS